MRTFLSPGNKCDNYRTQPPGQGEGEGDAQGGKPGLGVIPDIKLHTDNFPKASSQGGDTEIDQKMSRSAPDHHGQTKDGKNDGNGGVDGEKGKGGIADDHRPSQDLYAARESGVKT